MMAQADIGIAIGAGTDVAVETADIILVRNDPRDVVRLSNGTYSKMKQNLLWATTLLQSHSQQAYFTVPLSPAIGAILMSLSTVIVAINAKLLRSR